MDRDGVDGDRPSDEALVEAPGLASETLGMFASRRLLLKATLTLPALSVLGCTNRSADSTQQQLQPQSQPQPQPHPLAYFDPGERDFIDAATQRLIPDGDDGLGARAAAVTAFIDSQLAGPYGQAAAWYMEGPFAKGTPEQGYQLALTPAQLYRAAIADVEAHCTDKLGKRFAALSAADQDATLHALEKGDLELPHAAAKDFFEMLLKNTQEGFLADPLYGGNRGFAGWRLIGFPGPRYNYMFDITQYGKPFTLPTVGLLGRNGKLVWS
jgi:gluconate 2-dehydrogenase gamma chain